jgi:peptidyl-prolyl cis-trans isomerase B (cyclophilin B)
LTIRPSRYESQRRPDLLYTVFGEIFRGIEVLDKIVAAARDAADNPIEPITMTMTVKE